MAGGCAPFLSFLSFLLTGISAIPCPAVAQSVPRELAHSAASRATNRQLAAEKLNARVDALLARMTLEEKVGQLVQESAGVPAGPGTGLRGSKRSGTAESIRIRRTRRHL